MVHYLRVVMNVWWRQTWSWTAWATPWAPLRAEVVEVDIAAAAFPPPFPPPLRGGVVTMMVMGPSWWGGGHFFPILFLPSSPFLSPYSLHPPLCSPPQEFKHCSILLCDIVGFTMFSAGQDAAKIVWILNDMFTKFDDECCALGVEKIKTIGDAYLCVAGVPKKDNQHQEKIAWLGLNLLKLMGEVNSGV